MLLEKPVRQNNVPIYVFVGLPWHILCLSMSIYFVYLCLPMSIYVRLCLPMSILVYQCLSLSASVYLCLCLFSYVYLCLFMSIILYLYIHLRPSMSIYVYASISVYVYARRLCIALPAPLDRPPGAFGSPSRPTGKRIA